MKNLLLLSCLVLTACSATVPIAVMGEDGRILRGTTTASMAGGSFSVTDGKLTCKGSYNPLTESDVISMPTVCSDGRRGIVRAIRETATSGHGKIKLNDGYTADMIFGEDAGNL